MAKEYRVVYPLLARTATPAVVPLEVKDFSGIILSIDVTAIAATPLLTVSIFGVDRISTKKYLILASAVISTVSTVVMEVSPGSDEAANLTENAYLPYDIQIEASHGDADSITYRVSAVLLP